MRHSRLPSAITFVCGVSHARPHECQPKTFCMCFKQTKSHRRRTRVAAMVSVKKTMCCLRDESQTLTFVLVSTVPGFSISFRLGGGGRRKSLRRRSHRDTLTRTQGLSREYVLRLSGRRSLHCGHYHNLRHPIKCTVSGTNGQSEFLMHSARFFSRRSCHHCEQSAAAENGGRHQRKSWTSRPPTCQKKTLSQRQSTAKVCATEALPAPAVCSAPSPVFAPAPAVDHIAPTGSTSGTNACDRTDNVRGERLHPQGVVLEKKK